MNEVDRTSLLKPQLEPNASDAKKGTWGTNLSILDFSLALDLSISSLIRNLIVQILSTFVLYCVALRHKGFECKFR